jgi:pyrroloquinoline quinone (PQQ) biosynthesis protein C
MLEAKLGDVVAYSHVVRSVVEDVEGKVGRVFEAAMAELLRSSPVAILMSGSLTSDMYKSFLQEIYHYTKENPQKQALATVFFRGSDREWVLPFLKHAASEVGHDKMALDDAAVLGADPEAMVRSSPLPATMAFTSYAYYQIYNRRPVGYLGYLYFLEHMGTGAGGQFAAALKLCGIPEAATSFLTEHRVADVGHNRLMSQYLKALVHTEADLREVCYAIRVTGNLYIAMASQAFERAREPSQLRLGNDVTEHP